MNLTIKKKIGVSEYDFTVSGTNLWEVVMEMENLSFPNISKCGLCGSDWLRLTAYETKEDKYHYVKVVCHKCHGSLTFGQQKKNPNQFYLRKNEQGKQDWKENPKSAEISASDVKEVMCGEDSDGGIPF